MKEEDITNVAQSLLYDSPQDETVFERPQVVDNKGVQVRVSGSMLDINTSAIAASPSEDVTSTDLLFHIAEDVLVPLLPDKEYVREKVVPLKPKKVSEDIKEDDTLAVTIAPIVVGGSMDQPGFEMQDCKYSEEEYAIATSDSTAAAAARVSEIIHEEYAPTQKLQATASAPSNKISVREVLDGSSRSQHLEIFSPQTDQHVTTDLLPPFVDNLIRGPSSNHTCSAPLVERSVVGFGPTVSMAGHEKLWSLSGTTLVSSVGYSASTGLPGSGWDQLQLLLSDSLLIVPTSYIFGSLLSTSDLFSSESWMVLVYRGSLSAGTRSVLPTPAQAYYLPNATTKELHANDPLLIQLGDHFISTVASAGNDSSSHNNLLDDPVMNSTPESCSDYYAPVSVSWRRASSQEAAASQYLVQYREEDFNRDDLLHKTIDNLISLLLGVLLCCLLSNPALCLLLIVFWLLFESTAGQPAASPAQVRSNNGLDIPPNKHGQVLLGFTGLPGPFGTNVWYDQPLADGFLISDEVVNVVVPDVPSGNFYFIQLSGDVATSDQDTPFTIINPKSPAQPLSEVVEPSTIAISSAPSATAIVFDLKHILSLSSLQYFKLCSPVLRMSAAVLIAAYAWIGCYAAAIIDPTKSPSIIRPNGADVWTVGSVQTIRWSNAGLDITNEQGRVVLGYNDPVTGRTNEYLVQPLADGFRLADEVVNIVAPEVPSGDFYYIVLLGNADNASPIFSIINPASPQENIQNVTFPTLLSIGSAPPATVSHSSSSTLTSPTKLRVHVDSARLSFQVGCL
ncbi:hypothetical protein ACG7TL_006586 [Trametes sanguinea]